MTVQQKDNWKKIGAIVAVVLAVTGWGRDVVGDRFSVGNRLTRIEIKVDALGETVALIANQRERIASIESAFNQVAGRLDRYEVRLNAVEEHR
jgi:hypothetical protein